jgi:hypothetical protein
MSPHTLRATDLTFKFSALIFSAVLWLGGCSTEVVQEPPVKDPPAKVFESSFEEVWKATQLAMAKYPVRVNTMDSGILETDFVKADKFFHDPAEAKSKPGLRYKITVRIVKGKVSKKNATKVTVLKSAELQSDFFSGYQAAPSNGLEEQSILYRIGRHLTMDKMLEAAASQPVPEK